jgi:RNA polymerase subunit RPABC4/transcription elongation factor Spt4
MEILFIVIVLAVIPGMIASSKGRSFFGFFLFGLLIWPVALVHALIMQPTQAETAARAHGQAKAEGRRPCPFCAEMIKREAKVCPHCRSELPARWSESGVMPKTGHGTSGNEAKRLGLDQFER